MVEEEEEEEEEGVLGVLDFDSDIEEIEREKSLGVCWWRCLR